MTKIYKAFCVACFDAGSSSPYCPNCCSAGTEIMLEQWQIDSIRQQASWIGKRYYPAKEDIEFHEELARLRGLITHFPGRTIKVVTHDSGKWYWEVTQKTSCKTQVSTLVQPISGSTDLEIMKASKLPYFDEASLL